jgi:acetyl-CoA C-acetyltransferase
MNTDPIVIVGLARTPLGAFRGHLKGFTAAELGAAAIRAAVERAKIRPEEVNEVIMGCVLAAGQGQAPARQASLAAGLPLASEASDFGRAFTEWRPNSNGWLTTCRAAGASMV